MLTVTVLTVAIAVFSGYIYLRREQLGLVGIGLAALRTIAVCALLLLLVNPVRSFRLPGGDPVVLLDASLSMGVAGGRWTAATDTALAIAGERGTVLRFGTDVGPFEQEPPEAGASRLSMALRSAVALGGPVFVVTDGELDDAGIVDPSLLENVSVVLLPRDTVVDVALLDVDVRERVVADDSVGVAVSIGTWGDGTPSTATLEVSITDRRIAVREFELPTAPGIARRQLVLSPGSLPNGTNVLRFRIQSSVDSVPEDDTRIRVVEVSEQPTVVVLMDPPDWEGRFLVAELGEVASTTVRGYAHVTPSLWLDMASTSPVSEEAVQRFARDAALLVVRGVRDDTTETRRTQPVWIWPTMLRDADDTPARDWYLSGSVQASPLAGRLTSVRWDSVPPVAGLAQPLSGSSDWVAISARQGRRGAERPALLGHDSVGVRKLVTHGTGWWRWRLRGGASLEAYRAILAAGTDWLLETSGPGSNRLTVASTVVRRDEPIIFRLSGDSIPDSLTVALTQAGDQSVETHLIRFDSYGTALLALRPGVYRWRAAEIDEMRGVVAVEEYSEEYHPRTVADISGGNAAGMTLVERYARDNWWLFLIVVVALACEWAWRLRRGLS